MKTDLSKLNDQQRDAVLQSIDKNVVLLAGAGSGKTATMVKRTEYLISDYNVDPSNLMVVTFTNKAANEINERITKATGCELFWIGTFHRICTKLLRKFGHLMGINTFSILDQKEAKKVISVVLKEKGLDASPESLKNYQARISHMKNEVIKPSVAITYGEERSFAEVYQEYQNKLWRAKTFDFDDLIIYTILLLSIDEVKQYVHDNIHYVMVDEMQDSNKAQFMLINLIAQDNNVMMIGDVNQSIYGFRNARPELLNDFVNTHPNTVQLKLEQNYRSTKTIIDAANEVVNNNSFGTKLKMFCDNERGQKIQTYHARNPYEEAQWILSEIVADCQMTGKNYSDYAIIYRANYQSRIIEDHLTREGIPYVVFGAISFYARKETRDLLAFCKTVSNPMDVEAFTRVLGTLKGVGKQTCENIAALDRDTHVALNMFLANPTSKVSAGSMNALRNLAKILNASYKKCSDVISDVLYLTDYRKKFTLLKGDDAAESIEIIDEFVDMINAMEEDDPTLKMEEMIDKISLLSDAKGEEKSKQNAVKLMTAHASKGLEFNTVFVIGCEEGSFPHINSIQSENPKDSIEEERRLFYVAMTRAEKKLYITLSDTKMKKDVGIVPLKESRFVGEIPEELTEEAI